MRPPETLDDVVPYAMEVLRSKHGSGSTIDDDPFQLGLVNPLFASLLERAVISLLFQSQDWSPVQRLYHKNGQVFEWRIKLKSGQVLPVFFDIAQVNNTAPVSPKIREAFYTGNRDKFQAEYVEPIEQLLSERKIEEAKFDGLIQANKEVSEIRITGEVAAA